MGVEPPHANDGEHESGSGLSTLTWSGDVIAGDSATIQDANMKPMNMDNSEFESSCSLLEDPNAAGDVIGTNKEDKHDECSDDADRKPDADSNNGEPRHDNDSDDEPANDNSHREDGAYVSSENDNEDHVNDYCASQCSHMSPPRIQVEQVDFTTPHGCQSSKQISKRHRSHDISASSRHSKASKWSVSSVASSRGPVSRSASPLDTSLQGASRISGRLLRSKAVGNAGNNADYGLFSRFLPFFLLSHYWSDVHMDSDVELPAKVSGKVLLYVNRDAEEPLMAIRQEVTSDLSTILQGLSVYYSPVKSKSKGMFPFFFLIFISQNLTIACMFGRRTCGPVKVVLPPLSMIQIQFNGI
jgi:hypothetical protein